MRRNIVFYASIFTIIFSGCSSCHLKPKLREGEVLIKKTVVITGIQRFSCACMEYGLIKETIKTFPIKIIRRPYDAYILPGDSIFIRAAVFKNGVYEVESVDWKFIPPHEKIDTTSIFKPLVKTE